MKCFRGAARIELFEPNLQLYWEEIGFQIPNPDPTDSPNTLLSKSSQILEHYYSYYNLSVQEPHTWSELAQSLVIANTATPAGIGVHPNLNLLTELLNPGSPLYIEGTRSIDRKCGRPKKKLSRKEEILSLRPQTHLSSGEKKDSKSDWARYI